MLGGPEALDARMRYYLSMSDDTSITTVKRSQARCRGNNGGKRWPAAVLAVLAAIWWSGAAVAIEATGASK